MAALSASVRRGFFMLRVGLSAALLLLTATQVMADPIPVNCDQGQSLNQPIARLDKRIPATALVNGTCTEFVTIYGFEGLTLKGLPGATLQQPVTNPGNGLLILSLSIGASRSITVDGLAIHSRASALAGIGIGQNSIDVRLRNLTVDGAGVFDYWLVQCQPSSTSAANEPACWGSEIRLTDSSFNMEAVSINVFGGIFLGDYFGLAAASDDFVSIFTAVDSQNITSIFARRVGP